MVCYAKIATEGLAAVAKSGDQGKASEEHGQGGRLGNVVGRIELYGIDAATGPTVSPGSFAPVKSSRVV